MGQITIMRVCAGMIRGLVGYRTIFGLAARSALAMLGAFVVLPLRAPGQTAAYRTEAAFPGITFNQPLGFATPR